MNSQEIKKLEEKISKLIRNKLPKNAKIIIGLSGGADSVFLTEILKKLEFPIIAVHLNHNLRGRDSKKDQKFVQDFCTENKIQLIIKSLDIKKLSKKYKKSLEETGRKERNKLFQDTLNKEKFTHILLAHHANDNIETILGNLIRGGSINGLKGIDIIKDKIFRPLLFTTKEEILNYLKSKKINFREDKSNKDTIFKRNFIRHKIIPLLKKLNPNLIKTFTKNAEINSDIIDYLDIQAKNWIKKYQIKTDKDKKNLIKLDAKEFKKTHITIQKIILRKIYENLIGSTYDLESIHINEVLELINKNISNKEKKLGKLNLKIKSNFLILEKSVK